MKSYGSGGLKVATKASTSSIRLANVINNASMMDDNLVELSVIATHLIVYN